MDTTDIFSRIWSAFDAGDILATCAWCGRMRIDETWLIPSRAALAAIDQRNALSHSICEVCIAGYSPTEEARPSSSGSSASGPRSTSSSNNGT